MIVDIFNSAFCNFQGVAYIFKPCYALILASPLYKIRNLRSIQDFINLVGYKSGLFCCNILQDLSNSINYCLLIFRFNCNNIDKLNHFSIFEMTDMKFSLIFGDIFIYGLIYI